ncbi:MAG: peptidase M14 [Chloracidobacterium sp.]|nr:peptidase M14 [Chloracidobacterium sp.]
MRFGKIFGSSVAVFVFLFVVNAYSQSEMGKVAVEWQTAAERTDYKRTSTYDETVAYCKKLAAASGGLITYTTYGKSGEGRDLPLLIAARDGAFSAKWARKSGKAVVLIQAGIHSGEIDGKDAGLALFRDIAITKTRIGLLKDVVILFQVIYNVDGHENSNAFMRINQNGPDEMGWRANATNLNLNRDYMKADAPETRAWLKLWNDWKPDLFIDCHVSNGADFQYNVNYDHSQFQNTSPSIRAWMSEHFDKNVVPKIEAEGNITTNYFDLVGREITEGIAIGPSTPRFSTGYTSIRDRAGILVETHVYKPYKSRVRGTYDLLRYTIEEVGKAKGSLFAANVIADTQTLERGKTYDEKRQFPLKIELTNRSTPFVLKGVEYKMEDSQISGGKKVVYGTTPKEYTIPRFDEGKVTASVAPPLYYIIPPQYKDVIEVLKLHGVKFTRLTKARELDVESYKLTEPKWATSSFENRITVNCKPLPIKEKRTYAAGSVIVPLDQEAANVAIHLLEPAGPDSFVAWGFFNSVFEQKEYGENYILEKLAEKMLAEDPKLQGEFDRRLLDPAFARNPRARLEFFYQHSPYYLKQKVGIYPVGRILIRQ